MDTFLRYATDSHQTKEWGVYLSEIGWKVEKVHHTYIFIRQIPFFHCSFIKIQHSKGPFPFARIESLAKKYRALSVIIEPHARGYDEDGFTKNGYQKSQHRLIYSSTIKIDIRKNENDLLKSFSENARRNIKKAQNNNLTIKAVSTKKGVDKDAFQKYYSLLKNLGKMKKFYVLPMEEHRQKMLAFKNTSVLLFAYEKGLTNPIAVVWYAYFENVFCYIQTGITKRGYELLANYLLVWEGIKLAKKLGLSVFDFEAAYDPRYPNENKKWKGYSEFKKRFHGEFISFPPSWIKIYNVPFEILYKISTLFSR